MRGSYCLTQSIMGVGGNVIVINADGVTLDLDGHTISSTANLAVGTAISVLSSIDNVTIRNGHIRGTGTVTSGAFSGSGFAPGISSSSTSRNIRVHDVTVSGCLSGGIVLSVSVATAVFSARRQQPAARRDRCSTPYLSPRAFLPMRTLPLSPLSLPWLRLAALVAASVLRFSPAAFAQGSLTPPGAPTPTMKTLDQVEPRIDIQRVNNPLPTDANYHFIISTPGSYYLSANLGVTKSNGIHVTVRGVTIDLNGFEISRASGSGGDGITIDLAANRCAVRNGSIVGFANGIQCTAVSGVRARGGAFSGLAVSACLGIGLVTGEAWEVLGCKAHDNAGVGIVASTASTLRHCTASNNGSTGISTSSGCTLSDCIAVQNSGTAGISVGSASTLLNCVAFNNTGTNGILTSFGCALHNCAARANNGPGSASAGISVSSESTVIACVATNNATSNGTSTFDTGVGIRAGAGSVVKDCVAQGNRGDGIQVVSRCVITGNQCDTNGLNGDGAGIHVTSFDNRIEANNVAANTRGIDVDSTGNLVIRNSASGNTTNYVIAAGNAVGQIFSAPASGAINGSTGGSGVNTTDPWANLSY